MLIHAVRAADVATWALLRSKLWRSADASELAAEAHDFVAGKAIPTIAAVFIAEEGTTAVGFLELAVRSFSDGCDSMPVPHVEGWYVEPFARGKGAGRALMDAAEGWARERGFTELASDTEPWNERSIAAHARCGFRETERLVKFCKSLR
ncbi:MAG: GNAT family N-acetyltransferase [Candidatus Eremiobacteraeota bacterium]|nr:GNAT family N-acetyltransferase [Candidatus Eremiobacteraeota bacterium]MBV8498490.1 GNAT family N-acetyltransferase [Candidatus Eremiobacteraeota bacterium]